MYRVTYCGRFCEDIDVTDTHYFDPVKEDEVIVRDKALPMELRKGILVGMSHGWGVFNVESDEHKALYVTDYCNPCGSKSNPKIIPLHPIGQLNITHLRLITNAAMTCSPDQSNDFAVAVKCLGQEINFFRPGGKHEHSGSRIFKVLSNYFDQSKVMYSKRDEKFYTPSSGGHFLVFYDSLFEEDLGGSDLHELRFYNLPEMTQPEWELLDSCFTTAHLVESPSGQRFLIKWYAQNYQPGKE